MSSIRKTCGILPGVIFMRIQQISMSKSKFYSTNGVQNEIVIDGVQVETKGAARTIWLDNIKKKNAMTKQMYEGITNILNHTAKDDQVKLCILRGKGEYFCSGTDLTNLDLGDNSTLRNFIASFIDFPKIMIAAVNGPAIGIGTTILGLCDVVYVKDTATFVTPFSSLGLCPEACSSYTFPQLMGKRKAFELLMLGKKINALEAKDRYNLVTEIFSSQEFDIEIEKKVSELAQMPKLSLLFSKQLIQANDTEILYKTNEMEVERVSMCKNSDDMKAALEKFFQRKK